MKFGGPQSDEMAWVIVAHEPPLTPKSACLNWVVTAPSTSRGRGLPALLDFCTHASAALGNAGCHGRGSSLDAAKELEVDSSFGRPPEFQRLLIARATSVLRA